VGDTGISSGQSDSWYEVDRYKDQKS
jgi:hypothetical protein